MCFESVEKDGAMYAEYRRKRTLELIDLVLLHDPNAPIRLLTDVISDWSDLFDGEQVGAPDPCRAIVRGGTNGLPPQLASLAPNGFNKPDPRDRQRTALPAHT
jgi:hypothetical protein